MGSNQNYDDGEWYTEDGRQVQVESALGNAFVVREILEHEDIEPWISDRQMVVARVFEGAPPTAKLHEEVAAMMEEKARLKSEAQGLGSYLRVCQREKEKFDKSLASSDVGRTIAAVLEGTAWVVGYDDGVPVAAPMQGASHLAENSSGDRYGGPSCCLNLYIGSGGAPRLKLSDRGRYNIFATQGEAELEARSKRTEILGGYSEWHAKKVAEWCEKNGERVPEEVTEARRARDAAKLEDEIQKTEASLAAKRAKLAELV